MIVNRTQKNVKYFKQYPSHLVNAHLSQHREMQYHQIKYINFQGATQSSNQLPKYLIDQFDDGEKMYWLEWTMQRVSSGNKMYEQTNLMRCVYIAELGKLAHVKFIFNHDPERIAISNRYLYLLGGQQLIITQIWPQITSKMNLESSQQIKQTQNLQSIVHKLQNAQILSMNFVYSPHQVSVCKIIYFHQKKGFFSQTYSKHQRKQRSFFNKIIDFSYKFKKNYFKPFLYQTLIPNILGLVFHNESQFSLINLTELRIIEKTRTKLQGWSLDPNKSVIIRTRNNQRNNNFNDCLTISIGQSCNIELFLYNIKYSSQFIVNLDKPQPASEIFRPISIFTSGEVISYEESILNHFSIIYLDEINELKDYVLSRYGLIYLGYKQKIQQIPQAGFVMYIQPYMTYEILTQQHKIWRQFKIDSIEKYQHIERLLIPGRYEKQFILKTLGLSNILDLKHKKLTSQIQQKLAFDWRTQYRFIEFVIYKDEILIIRKNSIGSLVPIDEQQFQNQQDEFSQTQISYNELLSQQFQVRGNFDTDINEDHSFNRQNYRSSRYEGRFRNCKSYEDKMKLLTTIEGVYQECLFENLLQQKQGEYHDDEQVKKYSNVYRKNMKQIMMVSKLNNLKATTKRNSLSAQVSLQPLQKSLLSLRVKDRIFFYLSKLRLTYPFFILSCQQALKKQNQSSSIYQFYAQLQQKHFQHIYVLRILEFLTNITTKLFLLEQYQSFNQDLIDQLIDSYIVKNCQHQLWKCDIELHIVNVLNLIFRNLVFEVEPLFNQSRIIDLSLNDEEIIKQRVSVLNFKNNDFLLILLKRLDRLPAILNILMSLFSQLIVEPFDSSITQLIPLSKTLVYSILELPIQYDKKALILNTMFSTCKGLDILILIQTQNNLDRQCLQNRLDSFQLNQLQSCSHRLSHQNSYLIQELILLKFKDFLFSNKGLQESESLFHILYRNIEFNSIMTIQSVNLYNTRNIARMISKLNNYLVNQFYNVLKKDVNVVENTFRKYYKKIYSKSKLIHKDQFKINSISKIHPETTNQTLSIWQLNQFSSLYRRFEHHLKKNENIQQRLNLEYAMLKIHVFRFKHGSLQIRHLDEEGRIEYSKVLNECLKQIKQSSDKFKNIYPQLHTQTQAKINKLTDAEFIKIVKISSSLQKCERMIDQTDTEEENLQNEWRLFGRQITQKWLSLLQLTLDGRDIVFVNYHDFNSVMMKILKVIFSQNLIEELQNLFELFQKQEIETIIKASDELVKLCLNSHQKKNKHSGEKHDVLRCPRGFG